MLHPFELRCTLLSYAASPTELRLPLNELRGPPTAASLILPTKYTEKPREISRNKMVLFFFRPELGLPEAYIFPLDQTGFVI